MSFIARKGELLRLAATRSRDEGDEATQDEGNASSKSNEGSSIGGPPIQNRVRTFGREEGSDYSPNANQDAKDAQCLWRAGGRRRKEQDNPDSYPETSHNIESDRRKGVIPNPHQTIWADEACKTHGYD
jgi:hypothetical protein